MLFWKVVINECVLFWTHTCCIWRRAHPDCHRRSGLFWKINDRLISSASIVEIALKHALGKIGMPEVFVRQAVDDLGLSIIAFERRHAYQLFSLPLHHRDPFDRMIIATAVAEDMPLVGGDRQCARYSGLRRTW